MEIGLGLVRGGVPPGLRRAAVPGRRRKVLLFGRELRALLGVAGPLVVSQLGGIAMNTTDTLMVGPLGAESLAAVALANAVHITTLMIAGGILMGMGPMVSQAFGAGDRDQCRRVLVQGLWLGMALAVPLILVSLFGARITALLNGDPEVSRLAGQYLLALAPGVFPVMVFAAFRQYLDGMGLTRPAMLFTFLGALVNVVGNTILIHGVDGVVPRMGVVGAGLSTSIVRWSMLAAMLVFILRRSDLQPFRGASLRPRLARIGKVLAIGGPIGVGIGAEVGIFAFGAVMMGWLGPVPMAAHQVTINIASATFMVALGAALAGCIRVGQHVGARNPRAVRRAAVAAYVLSIGFMALCALLFLAAPRFLIGLYSGDPEIVRIGAQLMFMAALFQVFDGAQVAGLMVLRGAADTRVPMLITIVGYWLIGLPVGYLLGFRTPMEHMGIWTGLTVSLAVVSVLLAWRVRLVIWRRPLVSVVSAPAPAKLDVAKAVPLAVAGD
jgi:multidrug resistance protein, MATE family